MQRRFRYRNDIGEESACAVQVDRARLPRYGSAHIVTLSPLGEEWPDGTWIMPQHVATQVCEEWELDPAEVLWVFQSGPRSRLPWKRPREVQIVTFDLCVNRGHLERPEYCRLTPDQLKAAVRGRTPTGMEGLQLRGVREEIVFPDYECCCRGKVPCLADG